MASGEIVVAPNLGSLTAEVAALLRGRLQAALDRLAASTQRAYGDAFSAFAKWLRAWLPNAAPEIRFAFDSRCGLPTTDSWRTVVALLEVGPLVAGTVVDTFVHESSTYVRPKVGKPLATATVALRVAALRWVVRTARAAGVISWTLEDVRSDKVVSLRDTKGPGLRVAQRMLAVADEQGGLIGARDGALLALLLVLGLRRGEVTDLKAEHLDVAGARLSVLGKGKKDRQWLTLPPALLARLVCYLELRGALSDSAPLFESCDRAHRSRGGLTASGIFRRVRHLGRKVEDALRVSPHRLRHTAITLALDALRGDVRRVRAFSRHAKVDTVLVYDDARADVGGGVAAVVAGVIGVGNVSP